jgi:hypothetical protein
MAAQRGFPHAEQPAHRLVNPIALPRAFDMALGADASGKRCFEIERLDAGTGGTPRLFFIMNLHGAQAALCSLFKRVNCIGFAINPGGQRLRWFEWIVDQ